MKEQDKIKKDEEVKNTQKENEEKETNKKKKGTSALVAASKARSAVDHVNKHAYSDVDFSHTGTNLTYREGEDEK